MAWNPSPEVGALRDFGKKFGRKIVITISVGLDGKTIHVTTYGETMKLCKLAGGLGDEIMRAINDGRIEPPDAEPFADATGAKTWTEVERTNCAKIGAAK